MTKVERHNWIINLEDVSSQVDKETVKFICGKYGAKNIYSLSSCDLQEVYGELLQYAVDASD